MEQAFDFFFNLSRITIYTRYPRAGDKPEAELNFFQQIYFHKLGTPESTDAYSAGRDFPRIAEIEFDTSRASCSTPTILADSPPPDLRRKQSCTRATLSARVSKYMSAPSRAIAEVLSRQ